MHTFLCAVTFASEVILFAAYVTFIINQLLKSAQIKNLDESSEESLIFNLYLWLGLL